MPEDGTVGWVEVVENEAGTSVEVSLSEDKYLALVGVCVICIRR